MVKPDTSATAGGVVAASRPSKAQSEVNPLSDNSVHNAARPSGSSPAKTRVGVADVSGEGRSQSSQAKKKTSETPEKKERIPWSAEEDAILRQLAEERDKDTEPNRSSKRLTWSTIAASFTNPTRTADQCYERWAKVLKPDLKKTAWTKMEDELLLKAYESLKNEKQMENKWSSIAKRLGGRSGKQVRERWINHLNPKIKTGPWTLEEDEILLRSHVVEKKNWSDMTELLASEDKEGRPANALKNRFNTSIKPAIGEIKDYATALELLRAVRQREGQFGTSGGKRLRHRDNTMNEPTKAAVPPVSQVMSSSSGSTEMSSGSSASELEPAIGQAKEETKEAALRHSSKAVDIQEKLQTATRQMADKPMVSVASIQQERAPEKPPLVVQEAVQRDSSKKDEAYRPETHAHRETPQSLNAQSLINGASEVVTVKQNKAPPPFTETKLTNTSPKDPVVTFPDQGVGKNKTTVQPLVEQDTQKTSVLLSVSKTSNTTQKPLHTTHASATPLPTSNDVQMLRQTQAGPRSAIRSQLPTLRKRETTASSQDVAIPEAKAAKLIMDTDIAPRPVYEGSTHKLASVGSSVSGHRKDPSEGSNPYDTISFPEVAHPVGNDGSAGTRTSALKSSSAAPGISMIPTTAAPLSKLQGLELLTKIALEREQPPQQNDLDRATPPPQVVQAAATVISPQVTYALPHQQVQVLIQYVPVQSGGATAPNSGYYQGQPIFLAAAPFATAYPGMATVPLQTIQIPPGASIGQVPMMAPRVFLMDPSASNKSPVDNDSS